MKQIIATLLLLFTACTLQAKDHDPDFFIRVLSDRATPISAGDSMLVSIVLYAQHPIAEASCKSSVKLTGKGSSQCSLRKLPINRNATASRVREGRSIYYTLVWDQYVVAPTAIGSYTIPTLKFTATLEEVVRMPDLFDQMMGARPETRRPQVSASSQPFTFKAQEKPRRSTREIMRSGGTML